MTQILPTDTERKLFSENLSADIRALALKLKPADDLRPKYVLQQIAGYQAMRKKMPQWTDCEGIVYPVHLSLEQCSSADTANYKRTILDRFCNKFDNFADLTSGFGVDFFAMSEPFGKAFYIERNEELCEIASHNFTVLGRRNFEVLNQDGVDFIKNSSLHFNCIFLDPARRDSHGGKTFHIQDCEPNIVEFQDVLLDKSDCVIVKLSPMLDITECLKFLKNIKALFVVAVDNECKELVAVLGGLDENALFVETKNNSQTYSYLRDDEANYTAAIADRVEEGMYLYEPNSAVMKAGPYRLLTRDFLVRKVHPVSHLYVSDSLVEDFPGRKFQIVRIGSPKDFKDLKKANIAVRNYPIKPDDLRKKMKLQDGGEVYLFATTIAGEKKLVIECRKV